MPQTASSLDLFLVVRNRTGMTDGEITDDDSRLFDSLLPSYTRFHEVPDNGRIEDGGFFHALVLGLIAAGLGVLTDALGLEPVFWDVVRALGLG
jgi:hypothetical protein